MDPAFLRGLSRPHRTFQTTLPTPAARTVRANQSAAARLRIRLPLELQRSESVRCDAQVVLVMSRHRAKRLRGMPRDCKPGLADFVRCVAASIPLGITEGP